MIADPSLEEPSSSWKTLKAYIIFFIAPAAFVIWVVPLIGREMMETPRRQVALLQRTADACPAIRNRVREMVADGKATDEEYEVVATLIANARAAPGGLKSCRRLED